MYIALIFVSPFANIYEGYFNTIRLVIFRFGRGTNRLTMLKVSQGGDFFFFFFPFSLLFWEVNPRA